MKTAAVIPVKRLDAALGRLEATLSAPSRKRLAEAMFLDLLTKIRRSQMIDEVLVVTADPAVARNARWLGHQVLVQDEDGGHAQAAGAGARAARQSGFDRVVMLPIDCPLFEPAELDDHLGRTPRAAMIVPDHHRSGTNALVLSPPDAFAPAFGPDSCARHVSRARAAGISFALEQIESLELDLDSAEDLRELRDALILDPQPAFRTAQILWDLGAETEPAAA
jgi:2-phospho-L-lactate guanylyltransferase